MVDLVKITPNQIVTRNTANTVLFDTNTNFMKAGGGQVYVEGYQGFPVASGGAYTPHKVRNEAADYVLFSSSLFGTAMNSIEGWIPRATALQVRDATQLERFFTLERYVSKPWANLTIDGVNAGTFRYLGLCGKIAGSPIMFVTIADLSFYSSEYASGYVVFPYDQYAVVTYLDNGAWYGGEYGNPYMCCDVFTSATPRSISYARTP